MNFSIEINEVPADSPRNKRGSSYLEALIVRKDLNIACGLESESFNTMTQVLWPEHYRAAVIQNFFSTLSSMLGEQMFPNGVFPKYNLVNPPVDKHQPECAVATS